MKKLSLLGLLFLIQPQLSDAAVNCSVVQGSNRYKNSVTKYPLIFGDNARQVSVIQGTLEGSILVNRGSLSKIFIYKKNPDGFLIEADAEKMNSTGSGQLSAEDLLTQDYIQIKCKGVSK